MWDIKMENPENNATMQMVQGPINIVDGSQANGSLVDLLYRSMDSLGLVKLRLPPPGGAQLRLLRRTKVKQSYFVRNGGSRTANLQ